MGSKGLGADVNLAWPTAQIAVMGASGAVGFIYRKELKQAHEKGLDVAELAKSFEREYEDHMLNLTRQQNAASSTQSSCHLRPVRWLHVTCACTPTRTLHVLPASTATSRCKK